MPLSSDNPFAAPSSLPFELPDFTRVTVANVREAMDAGLAEQRTEWDAIAADPEIPSVENTLVALEESGGILERALPVAWTLIESVGGEEWDALEAELQPKLAAHSDAFWLNEDIHRRMQSLALGQELLGLDAETQWLIAEYLRQFREHGISLTEGDKETLRDLNARISVAETEFSQRTTRALESATQFFDDAAQLAGLDEETLATMRQAARARSREGWAATLLSPTQQPLLTRLTDGATRRRILAASLARGSGVEAATDTRAALLELARLRAERARLLGFTNHAAAVAAEGTARSADAVAERLASMAPAAARNARREAAELAALKAETDPSPFEAADWMHYEDRLRSRLFSIDEEALRPYLELDAVLHDGVFWAATQLYGITFHEQQEVRGYAPEVRVWEVREEDGSPLGLFVGDYHARKGKRGGAWMHNLVDQSHRSGRRPVVMNNLNIPKPPEGEPVLLTWDEVTTAFHEFGHALHGLFSDAQWTMLSGTEVPRDFVEYPSQVNEMWLDNPHVVAHFARHHVTGEPLPGNVVQKLASMKTFGQGFATTEYLAAALLDQAWHQLAPEAVPDSVEDVLSFERNALAEAGLDLDTVPPRYRSTYFNHAFGGGYDANYYSYIWSEVLDADTVEWFETVASRNGDGGLNRQAGERFRNEVLSRGNTRDPLASFRAFRGRDADTTPLLRRRGLLA